MVDYRSGWQTPRLTAVHQQPYRQFEQGQHVTMCDTCKRPSPSTDVPDVLCLSLALSSSEKELEFRPHRHKQYPQEMHAIRNTPKTILSLQQSTYPLSPPCLSGFTPMKTCQPLATAFTQIFITAGTPEGFTYRERDEEPNPPEQPSSHHWWSGTARMGRWLFTWMSIYESTYIRYRKIASIIWGNELHHLLL